MVRHSDRDRAEDPGPRPGGPGAADAADASGAAGASGAAEAAARRLRELLHAGLLPRGVFTAALAELGDSRDWRRRADVLLLVLGAALVVAGVIFFVAYNWLAMDKFVKLIGLQAAVVGCVVAAWRRGLASITGRVLLFAACVFVGVFLAAFGQVYQTGADAWELFRAWALLMAVFVAASRDPVHWLLLLAVIDVSIASYLELVWFHTFDEGSWAWTILAGTQLVWLGGFEFARRGSYFATRVPWPRWVLVPAVLTVLTIPATMVILDDRTGSAPSWVTPGALVACLVGAYGAYRRALPDLFCLTCVGFCVAWCVTAVAMRLLDVFHHGGCGALFWIGLLVVALLTGLVRWIRGLANQMRGEADE